MADEVVAEREERRSDESRNDADPADVTGTLRLERERDSAAHDEHRPEEHRGARPLAEAEHGDRHREERRRPEGDRGARRPGLANPDGDEQVGQPRRDRARDEERKQRRASVTPPWSAAATQSTANVATCMRSAPTAAGTTGGTSAKRTATGIAPKQAAETSARRTASI